MDLEVAVKLRKGRARREVSIPSSERQDQDNCEANPKQNSKAGETAGWRRAGSGNSAHENL
jgi:hypothetical protein